jgi:hypothetical protein
MDISVTRNGKNLPTLAEKQNSLRRSLRIPTSELHSPQITQKRKFSQQNRNKSKIITINKVYTNQNAQHAI